jgi:hypothetical protein
MSLGCPVSYNCAINHVQTLKVLGTTLGLSPDQQLAYDGFWYEASQDGKVMPRVAAEAYFMAAGVDATVAAEVCNAAYGGGDAVDDRTAFAMGCKLVAMHQAGIVLTADNVVKPTPLPRIAPHGLNEGSDPQRPWLDINAKHDELKTSVIAGGSGAFAIRYCARCSTGFCTPGCHWFLHSLA